MTAWPTTDGLALEATAVVVEAGLTVWVRADEVEVLKLASPPKTAVIEWLPAVVGVATQVAVVPLKATEPVPQLMVLAPSLKVTVSLPDGVPEPGAVTATVAV